MTYAAIPLLPDERLVWCAVCCTVIADDPHHFAVAAHYLALHPEDLERFTESVRPEPPGRSAG